MFAMSPVRRLSMATTAWPRSSSASHRCDPMKPAPPVTTVLGIQQIPNPKSEIRNQKSQILVGDSTLEDAADEREPHDLQVERDRPVLNVIEVVLDPLLERGVAPPAVDLRPAG